MSNEAGPGAALNVPGSQREMPILLKEVQESWTLDDLDIADENNGSANFQIYTGTPDIEMKKNLKKHCSHSTRVWLPIENNLEG
ncbi:hypothetical protein MRB53_042310 [Persea americana]|nr:hypothetical protein MRB53_042310 [Persea americana]